MWKERKFQKVGTYWLKNVCVICEVYGGKSGPDGS